MPFHTTTATGLSHGPGLLRCGNCGHTFRYPILVPILLPASRPVTCPVCANVSNISDIAEAEFAGMAHQGDGSREDGWVSVGDDGGPPQPVLSPNPQRGCVSAASRSPTTFAYRHYTLATAVVVRLLSVGT
ncbi:hypothetical protein EDC01DRAFT_785132 [Geopyxis carbonaria]|nr:hypothetical protein EDC01DRAFT_785132 [Geopyxis carbonaria]